MKTNKSIEKVFWVTNTSNRNISLADLNLTIKAFSSVNLLNSKHYNFTEEQLKKSAESGSLFNKRDKLAIRNVAPPALKKTVPIVYSAFIPNRARSLYYIQDNKYEELEVTDENQKLSDENFAKENADLVELDQKLTIKKV